MTAAACAPSSSSSFYVGACREALGTLTDDELDELAAHVMRGGGR